ncbi:acetyl-CoA carboxylase carboxyltransferase subunit alpha [bacterium]|nr:acetyl-CoA carboxylase carboxyltransferase subunit alpha [bacterium]
MRNGYVLEFEKPIAEVEQKVAEMKQIARSGGLHSFSDEIQRMERKATKLKEEIYRKLTRWQKVQMARHPQRPYTLDYIPRICSNWTELHGDRCFADDKAIVGGLASIDDVPLMIIGHQKGRGTKENIYRNFGMPNPEGYRKALRLMMLAAKFQRPVVTFIDTPGAYPGLGAEERGQAEAIAHNLFEMARLPVPIVTIVIGEGGSGGALAISVADRIFMLEHAIYSVISPEGCASILYRDAAEAERAAEALKLTAPDLVKMKIVDGIIEEPLGGAHRDVDAMAVLIKEKILSTLKKLQKLSPEELMRARQEKYANIGFWME